MFCAPGLVFGGSEVVGSRFHVLRSCTCFRPVRFSCSALQDYIRVVQRTSGPIFMFCAPGLVFVGTEGVGPRFHVLHSRTRLGRYRGRWVSFAFLALPNSLGAVPRSLGPVFMFCPPGLFLGGTEGAGFGFHVLRSRTRFRRYRGRQVPFACFALPDLFRGFRRRRVAFSC
jgi:hypothetical protein